MKIAFVNNGDILSIYEAEAMPPFNHTENTFLIDATGRDIKLWDKYDKKTGEIISRPDEPEPAKWKDYLPEITWNSEKFEYIFDYKPAVIAIINQCQNEIEARDYRALKAIKLGIPLEELYPGEGIWYQEVMAKKKAAEADLKELENK